MSLVLLAFNDTRSTENLKNINWYSPTGLLTTWNQEMLAHLKMVVDCTLGLIFLTISVIRWPVHNICHQVACPWVSKVAHQFWWSGAGTKSTRRPWFFLSLGQIQLSLETKIEVINRLFAGKKSCASNCWWKREAGAGTSPEKCFQQRGKLKWTKMIFLQMI